MIDLAKLEHDLTIKPTLLSEAEQMAGQTYTHARNLRGTMAGIDQIWADARSAVVHASRAPGSDLQRMALAYRVNLETTALLADFLSISSSIDFNQQNPLGTPSGHGGQMIANTEKAREMLNSRPATKAWLVKRDAAMAAADEAQRMAQEQHRRDAPRVFLEIMRARGVHPELGDDGSIIVPPGTDMSKVLSTELRTFGDWKPELVALLQAEADVAEVMGEDRPRVLA